MLANPPLIFSFNPLFTPSPAPFGTLRNVILKIMRECSASSPREKGRKEKKEEREREREREKKRPASPRVN